MSDSESGDDRWEHAQRVAQMQARGQPGAAGVIPAQTSVVSLAAATRGFPPVFSYPSVAPWIAPGSAVGVPFLQGLAPAAALGMDLSALSGPAVKQPPRPVNSFLIFSNQFRKKLQEENKELTNAQISRLLGEKWRSLGRDVKARYEELARSVREEFIQKHPDYRWNASHETKKKKKTKASGSVPVISLPTDAAAPGPASGEKREAEESSPMTDGSASDGGEAEQSAAAGSNPAGSEGWSLPKRPRLSWQRPTEEGAAAMAALRRGRSFSAGDATPSGVAAAAAASRAAAPKPDGIPDDPLPPPRAAIPDYEARACGPSVTPPPLAYLPGPRYALLPVSTLPSMMGPAAASSAPASSTASRSASTASTASSAASAAAAAAAALGRRATVAGPAQLQEPPAAAPRRPSAPTDVPPYATHPAFLQAPFSYPGGAPYSFLPFGTAQPYPPMGGWPFGPAPGQPGGGPPGRAG